VSAWGASFGAAWGNAWGGAVTRQVFPVYGFAPDVRSQRYRRIDLRKYIKREEKPLADAPLKTVIRRANVRSELRYPLYFPVVYRKESRPVRDDSAQRWIEVLIEADRAYQHYKRLQEEEDIAFVMSVLATL
jgi:hypothetical protein